MNSFELVSAPGFTLSRRSGKFLNKMYITKIKNKALLNFDSQSYCLQNSFPSNFLFSDVAVGIVL